MCKNWKACLCLLNRYFLFLDTINNSAYKSLELSSPDHYVNMDNADNLRVGDLILVYDWERKRSRHEPVYYDCRMNPGIEDKEGQTNRSA